PVSAVLAIAEPHRIKRSHRRRGKVTSGRFVQRYYDPMIGRFLSVDPMASDMNTGWNFNRYNYAANNPYKYTDPDGRACDSASGGGCGQSVTGRSTGSEITVRDIIRFLETIDKESQPMMGGLAHGEHIAMGSIIRSLRPLATEAQITKNALKGAASEARVLKDMGLVKNTKKVMTAEGSAVPDGMTDNLLVEVKDVAKQSLTKQLRIETGAARAAGQKSILVTGKNTCVSGNCERAFDEVIRRTDLGPKK
ncbi:MAG: RHS repeat-associated core domain-containing protein, partial [Arenimonas sp.]